MSVTLVTPMLVFHTRCKARAISLTRRYSDQNLSIIDFLRRCQSDEETRPDVNTFKVTAYKHAIRSIAQVQHPIRLGNDISKLPGIGSGIIAKINEFLYASEAMENQRPRLELQQARVVKMLQDIPGIGPTTANKLIAAGCTSLDDLRLPHIISILTDKQKAKIRYMGHLEQHVEREDAEHVLAFCKQCLDPKFEITLVGEYRRRIFPFPEIQLMISHPDFVYLPLPIDPSPFSPATRSKKRKPTEPKQTDLLQSSILPVLKQQGLIADTLTSTQKSCQGVVRLPQQPGSWGDRAGRLVGIENLDGRFRKLSINLVSHKCRASSLLALTGDSDFYKHLQSQAKQYGMLLNEYGLWKWNQTFSSPSISESTDDADAEIDVVYDSPENEKGYWSLVKTCSEKDIFEELGIDFIEPATRNFSFISGKSRRKRRSL